jgi:transcriptional regulator with XRE-family HTH domain
VFDMASQPDATRRSVFPGFGDVAADPVELIQRLTAMRQAHDLSQTEVAARMGTSQSAVARLESGNADVRLSTLARYAAAVEADVGFALQVRKRDRDDVPARPSGDHVSPPT